MHNSRYDMTIFIYLIRQQFLAVYHPTQHPWQLSKWRLAHYALLLARPGNCQNIERESAVEKDGDRDGARESVACLASKGQPGPQHSTASSSVW